MTFWAVRRVPACVAGVSTLTASLRHGAVRLQSLELRVKGIDVERREPGTTFGLCGNGSDTRT